MTEETLAFLENQDCIEITSDQARIKVGTPVPFLTSVVADICYPLLNLT